MGHPTHDRCLLVDSAVLKTVLATLGVN